MISGVIEYAFGKEHHAFFTHQTFRELFNGFFANHSGKPTLPPQGRTHSNTPAQPAKKRSNAIRCCDRAKNGITVKGMFTGDMLAR